MPDRKYVRVTDDVKPRREYSVVESAVDPKVHTVLTDKPGAYADGQPIPPKYTPDSLSSNTPDADGQRGAIVNMASILGSVGFATSAAYVTAKHAIIGLTKNAALEYAAQGVRINAVGPGFIATPLIDANLTEEVQAFLASKHALGRLGTADEVAAVVAFLASDEAHLFVGSGLDRNVLFGDVQYCSNNLSHLR